MKIYHNPRCRKSRETLSILREKKVNIEIVEYLKNPLSKEEISSILKKLNISAKELIRTQEKVYKELYKGKIFTEEQCCDILVKNPILIERPIVIKDNSGVLGRPPINVLALLNN